MSNVWDMERIYAPSLITLDMLNLQSQIRDIEAAGVKMLHVDILDGHFSPSMPLGFETVKQLRKQTDLFFDCHVMTSELDYFVDELIEIGVQQIVFQIESANHVDGLLNKIHNAGIKAGVALKPATPLTVLDYILDKVDTVLLMLINPGYASSGKEAQIAYGDKKIRDLRSMIDARGTDTKISIDGRISNDNIKAYGNGMVDIFVLGTTCISKDDIIGSLKGLGYLMEKETYQTHKELVLKELDQALSFVSETTMQDLINEILNAEKVFFVGVGRVMLSLQAICKRLAHLGIDAHIVGEITEPAMTKSDLLIVGSGSGSTLFPVAIAKKANQIGARIVHIGSNPNSELSSIVNLMVRIPVQTKFYLEDEISSTQPMTSLFEQALLILGDIMALTIVKQKNLDLKSLWQYHANLE